MLLTITNDLLVTSPVAHAARQAGISFQTVAPTGISAAQWDSAPVLVLLDLNSANQVAEVVATIRESIGELVPIIAFGPHVHGDKLQAARDAGCTQVLTRGQFHASVAKLVAEMAGGS